MKQALSKASDGQHLTADEMTEVVGLIMDGVATPAQMGGLLVALRMKGETVDEIVGAARAMRARMVRVPFEGDVLDTCGTGGDGSRSVNISTIASFIVAGAGVVVAKHGNRAHVVALGLARRHRGAGAGPGAVARAGGALPARGEARLPVRAGAPRGHPARGRPAPRARPAHAVQHAGAADQPVRRALSHERHLQPPALRADGARARAARVGARVHRARRGQPGRDRAGRQDPRRRAARRRGADATRSRPATSASARPTRPACSAASPTSTPRS